MDNHAGNSYLDIDSTLKSKEYQIGWLAGIIDGEGTIGIWKCPCKQNGKRYVYYKPQFRVWNTNRKIIDKCVEILGGLGQSFHVMKSNPRHGRTVYRDLFRIDSSGMKRMKRFLDLITPYLVGKKEAAETTLAFVNSRLSKPMTCKNQGRGYDEYELGLVAKIREINRRGKDKRVLNDYEQGSES